MSDTHDDPPPNPAALDELLRAFSDGADVDVDPDDDGGDPTAPSDPPLEIRIVEQTAAEPVADARDTSRSFDDVPHPGPDGRSRSGPTGGSDAGSDEGSDEGSNAGPAAAKKIIRIDDGGVVDVGSAEGVDRDVAPAGDAGPSAATVEPPPTIIRIDDAGVVGVGSAEDVDRDVAPGDGVPSAATVGPPPTIIRIDDAGVVDVGSAEGVDSDVAPGDDGVAGAPPPDDDAPVGDTPEVIAIADADVPDAVYVEGNLEKTGSRTIVLIEDDVTGDTLAHDTERDVRRGIEPRLRERRAAVKRALGRKRLRWLIVGVTVLVIVVGTLSVLGSGLFAIRADNVTVVGAVYTDPDQLGAVVDDLVGTPILLADTQSAEERLEAIPWVEEARVRTDFPHSVAIDIRERQAMTTYQGRDQRYRVLDREGRVLDVLDGWPIAYVLLTGPDPVDLDAGEFAPQGYAAASELAKNLTGSVRNEVSSIDVTADGSRLSLLLVDGTEVRFGAARDLFAKLVRLETVLSSDVEREPGVIDVSTREVTL